MSVAQDVIKGIDPTGASAISGAQLASLVDGINPFTDIGFVKTTSDTGGVPAVPTATTGNDNAKWQRYFWRRITATDVKCYVWDPNRTSDATYLKWTLLTLASVADGSITGTMIANNTITDDNVSDVAYAKVTGVPASFPPSGSASGSLSGTYPSPLLNPPSIAGGVITPGNAATLQPAAIATPATSPGKILQIIGTGATAYAGWAQSGVIQRVVKAISGQSTSTSLVTASNPTVAEGTQLTSVAFTPLAPTSLIRVSFRGSVFMAQSGTNSDGYISLYGGSTLLNFGRCSWHTAPYWTMLNAVEAYYSNTTGGVVTFQVRLGVTVANTVYINLNANQSSYLIVEEFFGSLS